MSITPPRAVDPFAAFLNLVINGLITGVAAPTLEAAAEAQVPILAAPIIKQIFEDIVGYVAGKISVTEQQGVLTIVFDVEKDSKLYALAGAALALKQAQDSGDQHAIDEAKQKAIEGWGNLVHWGGVASVKS